MIVFSIDNSLKKLSVKHILANIYCWFYKEVQFFFQRNELQWVNCDYILLFIQTNQHARGTPECLDSFHREGHRISDVVLNKFHTLFLTTDGRVYTCGHGQGGRLGLDTNAPVITPRPIKAFTHTNVIRVASGTHHSLFLTDLGQASSVVLYCLFM